MICLRFSRKLLAPVLLGGASLAIGCGNVQAAAPLQASCHFHSAGDKIKRVVYLQFDNVHLRRDNPNMPSDLEQMPHLLNFLLDNGTVSGNHFTPLISHTAQDIVTSLTGLYGERFGWAVANSYGFFRADGSVGFQSSFLYWTAAAADGHKFLAAIGKITDERNDLASDMIALLNGAAFENKPVHGHAGLIDHAQRLIDKVEDMAEGGE